MESSQRLGIAAGLMVFGCWHLIAAAVASTSGKDREQMDQSIFEMVFQDAAAAFGDAVCCDLGADIRLWHDRIPLLCDGDGNRSFAGSFLFYLQQSQRYQNYSDGCFCDCSSICFWTLGGFRCFKSESVKSNVSNLCRK